MTTDTTATRSTLTWAPNIITVTVTAEDESRRTVTITVTPTVDAPATSHRRDAVERWGQ